jgi:uncharacterized protein YdeI (YjbR/CyaY-like superfamily)
MPQLFHKDLPVIAFTDSAEFESWLSSHHTQTTGFWLRYYKKASGVATIVHDQAVDVALCWGWIDGQINKYDDVSYLVRFTPRGKKSIWSAVNVAKVERLITENRMQPSGLVHIVNAQQDGRWQTAYQPQSTMQVPADYLHELSKHPNLKTNFETLTKAERYHIGFALSQITDQAKRSAKIQKLLDTLGK